MPVSRQIIDKTLATDTGEDAYKIVEVLTDAGFEAWWVGGCVRDMLGDIVPHEFDIATSAKPEDVKKLFPKHEAWGEQFGSIFVLLRKRKFEVTTFREDDDISDGRRPENVVFGTRENDAARRDITINALYFNPIGRELYDPFEAEKDLNEKLVRIIGDPTTRIRHDALRILRVVRFRARIDGQYHPETYTALRELAELVKILSGSRLLEELEKMLLGPRPGRALEDLWELGILSHFLPELHACKGIPQPKDFHHEGDVWDHMLHLVAAFTPDHGIDVRMAGLFHDCGKSETFSLKERIRFDEHATVSADQTLAVLSRMQCPAKRRDKIVWLVRHHMMMGAFFEMPEERKAHWYFHPYFPELLQLFWLDIAGTDPADFALYDKVLADYHAFLDSHPRPPKPLVSGDEVMEILGLPPGERVGEILATLHDLQVRKEITTKKEAVDWLKKQR